MAYKSETSKKEKEYFLESPVAQEQTSTDIADPFMPIPTAGSITTTPVIDNGTVFFGTCTKYFFAVDAKTGSQKWKFLTGDIITSSAAVYKDLVIFGSFDGYVYALKKETGRLKWKFRTNSRIWSSPVVIEGVVYIGSCDERLYALDAESGDLVWKFHAKGPITSEIVAANNMIISGSYNGRLFALDYKTGDALWTFRPFEIHYPSLAVSDRGRCVFNFYSRSENKMPRLENGRIYCATADKNLYALDLSGELKWKFLAPNGTLWCNFHDGVVYFGCYDNCLYAVHEGELYWKVRAGGWIFSCPLIYRDVVYFTSMDQSLYAVALDGQALWKFRTGGVLYSSPAIHGDVVYFGSDDTHVYAVDINTREMLWRFHTGMKTQLMKLPEITTVVSQLADFNKRIFRVWKPETKASGKLMQTSYTLSMEMPQTTYGPANPYKSKPQYKSKTAYDLQ